MKELLYGWIRDIAFYTLLMTVVLHVLPEKSQKKYLQFFMGVVLIILVISPALKMTGLSGRLDDTYTRQTFDSELLKFRLEEIGQGDDAEQEEPPRKGEDIGIPEIQVTIGEPEED